jgi:putative spermidine/putrescine transport system substrate-binding protein
LAGLSAGSGALTGFPMIWAQDIKDITLLHAGPPVAAIPKIGEQATKDLGFTIKMQATENVDLLNRFLSQSSAIDVGDVSIVFMKYLVGRNVLQAIPVAKYKDWDKVIPLFSKGIYPNGSEASTQGVAPYTVLYATGPDGQKFANGPTEWLTGIPTITNADTLGIRPDLVGRPIKSWADLISPEFKGKAALQDQPTVGVIDVALALEARGDVKYGNKGNMTRDEIDKTIAAMMDVKKAGQFRSFWSTFDQSVNLMASGEVVIQSMWSPAVTKVRQMGIACVYQPLKEGYRAWAAGLGLPTHLQGPMLDAAYEFINWYLSGWAGAFLNRQGYYTAVLDTAKQQMSPDEWDFWMEGKPAKGDILSPTGEKIESTGAVHDGGSFWDRMGRVSVWNTVMDEDRYMVRKWNEFVAA